jgi:hypothetical protein
MRYLLALLLSTIVCLGQADIRNADLRNASIGAGAAGGGSCAAWSGQSQETSNDYDVISSVWSQRLNLTGGGGTVCTNILRIYTASSVTVHVEFWSNATRDGTQYGSDSEQMAVSTSDIANEVAFYWTGTKPTLPGTGNVWMHVVVDSGSGNIRLGDDNSAPLGELYQDATYCVYDSGGNVYGGGRDDYWFKLYKE